MPKTTTKFLRVPSDAGVTFEGFEDLKLPSREAVRQKLDRFIEYCRKATGAAARIIVGEWGEGKTDAFHRYLAPRAREEGFHVFFISASTLANTYSLESATSVANKTPVEAVRFLLYVFQAAQQEGRPGSEKIPSLMPSETPEDYVARVLKQLIVGQPTPRIIFFIDEFEELLLYAEKLRAIVTGLKQTINGTYREVHEQGRFPGGVHFVLAATPEANYQLQVRKDIALVSGGLTRRVSIIDLPEISKAEGIEFLLELTRYSYDGRIPSPFAFTTIGIFEALFRITQGNPGNMVKLYANLLQSMPSIGKDRVSIIDHDHFLRFLRGEKVSVYGGETICLESETLARVIRKVGEQKDSKLGEDSAKILQILVAEPKPFSSAELGERSGCREDEVPRVVNVINEVLRTSENIPRSIVKVSRLKPSLSLDDFVKKLRKLGHVQIKGDIEHIVIDSFSEAVGAFEERMSHFKLSSGRVVKEYYLPIDESGVASSLDGVEAGTAREISNLFLSCADSERNYLASDELLSQVYPTPIPKELGFMTDRETRWKLWRQVKKNLAEQFSSDMPDAAVWLLSRLEAIEIVDKKRLDSGVSSVNLRFRDLRFRLVFYATNGDLRIDDIDRIQRFLAEAGGACHGIMAFYTGEILQDTQSKIELKEWDSSHQALFLDIPLHPTLARRLICVHRAAHTGGNALDAGLLDEAVEALANRELALVSKIENWLDLQEKRGSVLRKLEPSSASSLGELQGALKFYVNFQDQAMTPKETFDRNMDELLNQFVMYDAKIGLIPDLERPKFEQVSEELVRFGFLCERAGKYSVVFHPVEKRILEIVEQTGPMTKERLSDFLIMGSPRYLTDIFLPLLEYKGLIRLAGDVYESADIDRFRTAVKSLYENVMSRVSREGVKKYGYVYIWKKKGDSRLITVGNFSNYAQRLFELVQNQDPTSDRVLALQKLSLLNSLLLHFQSQFVPIFEEATKYAETMLRNADERLQQVRGKVQEVIEGCLKWLKMDIKEEAIAEWKQLSGERAELARLDSMDQSGVELLVSQFKEPDKQAFYFRNDSAKQIFLNPKIRKMNEHDESIKRIVETVDKNLDATRSLFSRLEEKLAALSSSRRSTHVAANLEIAKRYVGELDKALSQPFQEVELHTPSRVSVQEIVMHTKNSVGAMENRLDRLRDLLQVFDGLLSKETEAISKLVKSEELATRLQGLLDIKELQPAASQLKERLVQARNGMRELSEGVHGGAVENLHDEVERTVESISQIQTTTDSELAKTASVWKSYLDGFREFVVTLEKLLALMKERCAFDSQYLKEKLKQTEELVKAGDISNPRTKASQIEAARTDLQGAFYSAIIAARVLEKNELDVLQASIELARKSQSQWLVIGDVSDAVAARCALNSQEVLKAIFSLAGKKLLKLGLSPSL